MQGIMRKTEEGNKDLIFLGEIVNTQGCKGEVRLIPYLSLSSFVTGSRGDVVEEMKVVYLIDKVGQKKETQIISMREWKGFIIAKFAGYDTISQAEQLKNCRVACRRLPLVTGAYYVRDLIGMEVFTTEKKGQRRLGKIVDIFATGANDIYVIKDNKKEILFPALKRLVKQVDITSKKMVVELPEGLR